MESRVIMGALGGTELAIPMAADLMLRRRAGPCRIQRAALVDRITQRLSAWHAAG